VPPVERGGRGVKHYNERILVTGGAGFIGSHVCERLVRAGHDVICLDNLFTGNKANIAHLLDERNFEFIRHDVTEPLHLEVDQIYNLACPASPIHYQHDPVKTVKTSVHGAINVLDLAHRCGARVLQASSSEVYGDPNIHPQREVYWGNVNPIGPRACYDEGKRCAETLFFDYHRQHGVDIRVARIFNTYGPRMHPSDGRVVSNFIVQALLGRALTIAGDGNQTRSFCFVDDLVDGMIAYMDREAATPGPINLGNPNEMTVRELADVVLGVCGSESKIVWVPQPEDDPTRRRPDISQAKQLLGWEPKVVLAEGIAATVAYFRELLEEIPESRIVFFGP
jgi:UDP-glucuronate decarboxylase